MSQRTPDLWWMKNDRLPFTDMGGKKDSYDIYQKQTFFLYLLNNTEY